MQIPQHKMGDGRHFRKKPDITDTVPGQHQRRKPRKHFRRGRNLMGDMRARGIAPYPQRTLILRQHHCPQIPRTVQPRQIQTIPQGIHVSSVSGERRNDFRLPTTCQYCVNRFQRGFCLANCKCHRRHHSSAIQIAYFVFSSYKGARDST